MGHGSPGGPGVSRRWRTLSTREIYRNAWLSLREDQIERPVSGAGLYSVVERLESLAIVPRAADGSITLVRQYRYPVDRDSWEVPSGTLDPGEEPLAAARRELVEETGLTAAIWTPLGTFWLAPGFCSQVCRAYLAEALTQGEGRPEATEEDLVVRRFSLAEIESLIRAGELMDGLTISTLSLLRLSGR